MFISAGVINTGHDEIGIWKMLNYLHGRPKELFLAL